MSIDWREASLVESHSKFAANLKNENKQGKSHAWAGSCFHKPNHVSNNRFYDANAAVGTPAHALNVVKLDLLRTDVSGQFSLTQHIFIQAETMLTMGDPKSYSPAPLFAMSHTLRWIKSIFGLFASVSDFPK